MVRSCVNHEMTIAWPMLHYGMTMVRSWHVQWFPMAFDCAITITVRPRAAMTWSLLAMGCPWYFYGVWIARLGMLHGMVIAVLCDKP